MKGPGQSPARNQRRKVTHNFWITKQLHQFCKKNILTLTVCNPDIRAVCNKSYDIRQKSISLQVKIK